MRSRSEWKRFLVLTAGYTREAWRARRRLPEESFFHAMLLLPRWFRSFDSSPLASRQPWMSYGAISALEKTLTARMKVFEWGIGGSTLFFSERTSSVTSVEHDTSWSLEARQALAAAGRTNWDLIVIAPHARTDESPEDPGDPHAYASSLAVFAGMSFREYARAIDGVSIGPFANP